jgi:hypothetical protein
MRDFPERPDSACYEFNDYACREIFMVIFRRVLFKTLLADYTIISANSLEEVSSAMKQRFIPLLIGLGLAALFLAAAEPARAALGESADSVASDQTVLAAKRVGKTVRTGYTIQELRSDSVTLREYVAPTGIIFAIAWNGLIHPDLTTLLGSYVGNYRTALQHVQRQPGSRHRTVKTDEIVVEKWGHMRNLQGRAYVPALIPSGVSIDEIK